MKKYYFILLAIFFIGCDSPVKEKKDIEKLHWLIGEWEKKVKPGDKGFERWSLNSSGELNGMDLTMSGTDTLSFERISIREKEGSLFYIVDALGDTSVAFKFTLVNNEEFVCENETHDFPKKIHYAKNGDHLTATISGNGESMDFNFVKKSLKK